MSAQPPASIVVGLRFALRVHLAPVCRRAIEDVVGGLDAAGGLEFVQEIAGRKRRDPLGQPADEPASSDVAVLEQQNRFEIGVFRDRGIEHFEGGALAAPA